MDENYCRLFSAAAATHSGQVALQNFGDEIQDACTYGQLLEETYAIASGLKSLGVIKGTRIAVLGENQPLWAAVYLGALFAEALVVPLDIQLSADELRILLEDSGASVIFSTGSQLEKVFRARSSQSQSITAVCFDREGEQDGSIPLKTLMQTGRAASCVTAPPDCGEDDAAILVYTSGTTGKPKGVLITHHNLISQVRGVTSRLNVGENDRLLGILPLHHVYAQLGNFLMPLALGAAVTYLQKMSSQNLLKALSDCRITILIGVPQLYYLFHQKIFDAVRSRPFFSRAMFRLLFWIAGASMRRASLPLGKVVFRSVHQKFGGHIRIMASAGSSFDARVARDLSALGFVILQGYGLSETSGAATITPLHQRRVGTVGMPIDGVEVKIDRPDACGIGEVLIRGDVVMKGYYKRPDLTAEVIRDGWFHSGDLGYLASGGLLYITGRQKDVIVLSNGKNVYPEEIESHYAACPAISELCVLGRSGGGRYGEEELFALIVPDFDYLRAHKIANAGEVIRYDVENLSRSLPKHKRILNYRIQAAPLPRTSTRKIKRFEVQTSLAHDPESSAGEVAGPVNSGASDSLLATEVGKRVASAVMAASNRRVVLSPESSIELDLGFDSLRRIELVASIEQLFGIKFGDEQVAEIYTIGQLVEQVRALTHGQIPRADSRSVSMRSWKEIIESADEDSATNDSVLQPGPVGVLFGYLVLRCVFLLAKVLFRLEVRGIRHLPQARPYLICPNHQSFIDPFVICSTYPYSITKDVFHLGATEYFSTPLTRRVARMMNVVPVDPDVNLARAMNAAAIRLRRGKILTIYPEGSRTPDGELKEFKKGSAILAAELRIPIVPVAISGAYDVWPRATMKIRLAKVRVAFGAPIDVPTLLDQWGHISEDERYTRLNEVLRDRVAELLETITPIQKS